MSNPSPRDIQEHIASLAPVGGLGRLAELATRLCEIQHTLKPVAIPRRLVLFAGAGASEAMVRGVLSGSAAPAVLAKHTNTELVLVDVGSPVGAMPDAPNYRSRKVRHASTQPLTPDEFRAAFTVGQLEADRAAAEGVKVVAAEPLRGGVAGELSELLAAPASDGDLIETIAPLCPVEVAASAGFLARAAERGLTVVATQDAAARVAERLYPGALGSPLSPWGRGLGEGSCEAPLLTFPLLDAAVALVTQAAPVADAKPPAEPKPARKVAVFTGSFDPPTNFHRKVARLVRGRGFDEVVVRPTGPRCDSPDGEHATPVHRAVMADLAFRDLPGVSVDLGDLDDGECLDDYRFDEVYAGRGEVWHVVAAEFLKGGGAGRSLIQTRWPNGTELWANGRFVVLHPTATQPDPADLPPRHKFIAIDDHVPTADIRIRVFQGGEAAPDVPQGVADYIQRYRLFSGIPSPRETQIKLDDARLMLVFDENNAKARELAGRFKALESTDPTAILVIGGDGTMLSAIRQHWRKRLPFLGLNAGTLGFLMNEELPDELAGTDLVVYRMPMLRVGTTAPDGTVSHGLAYGDAWVERDSGQAAWLRIDVDGRTQVPKVVGDGFLIATPSGSSAYARAMGATPVPLTAPVLTLAGSNVFRPRFWKPVALPETATVRITSLDTNGKRPVRAFLDGHLVGRVSALEARASSVAAVELAFTPRFDLSERLLRSMFPPSEEG